MLRPGPADRRTAPRPSVSAPLLMLGSVLSVQFGQAFGKQLIGELGPAGVVTLRLGFAALVLLAVWRPRPPATWRSLRLILAFGTAIAGMNIIYLALMFLPLAVATTLQLLGPLGVALAGSRRPLDVAWAVLAAGGVVLFVQPDAAAHLPLVGICAALLAALAMGAYVLLSHRAGARAADGSILALAVTWAALSTLPFGLVGAGTALFAPAALAAGLGVAVLSAVLPYSLELAAIRRLPPRVVGLLLSLEPVVGAVAGSLLLAEQPAATQLVAIACVTAASIGSVLTRHP